MTSTGEGQCPNAYVLLLSVFALFSLLLLPQVVTAQPVGRVLPLSGPAFDAQVQQIRDDWTVVFVDGDGTEKPQLIWDIAGWGTYDDGSPAGQLLLADGSIIVANVIGLADREVRCYSRLWGEFALPLATIAAISFEPPENLEERDRLWNRIQATDVPQDQLILENGDVISGIVQQLAEAEDANEGASAEIRFSAKERSVAIPIGQVAALVLNPALTEQPRNNTAVVWMGLRDGSLLAVESLKTQSGIQRLSLLGAAEMQLPTEDLVAYTTLLQPDSDRVAYLSDLQSLGFKQIPFWDEARPLQLDRNVLDGRLRSVDCCYRKGLGVQSMSRIACRLDGVYRRFVAELSIDRRAGLAGSVRFRIILGTASGTWETAYESPLLRGGDAAIPVTVELEAARTLVLIVDFGERGHLCDYANWLNARLLK